MIERKIKELSIALEALSNINSYAAVNLSDDVTDLLKAAVKQAKEENKEQDEAPTTTTSDDNIPF